MRGKDEKLGFKRKKTEKDYGKITWKRTLIKKMIGKIWDYMREANIVEERTEMVTNIKW